MIIEIRDLPKDRKVQRILIEFCDETTDVEKPDTASPETVQSTFDTRMEKSQESTESTPEVTIQDQVNDLAEELLPVPEEMTNFEF